MKKILLSCAMLLSVAGFAQKMEASQMPATVTNAFTTKFPSTTVTSWEAQASGEYVANFKQNGQTVAARFGSNGSWIQTEVPVAVSALPAAIPTYIGRQGTISSAFKILKANKEVNYRAIVRGSGVLFAQDGTYIKIEN
jgi:hypothetical protein